LVISAPPPPSYLLPLPPAHLLMPSAHFVLQQNPEADALPKCPHLQPPLRASAGRDRRRRPSHRVRHFVSCPIVDFISSVSHRSYAGDLTRATATSPAVKTLDP
jgi:hypothetical protein